MCYWLDKVIDLFINFGGVFIGAFLGYKASKSQDLNATKKTRKAHIGNMLNEYEYNLNRFERMKTYIVEGPPIEHLWSPAEVIADHIKVEAWNELIKAGVLTSLEEKDRNSFALTNNRVMDAKCYIKEMSANWVRVGEWYDSNLEKQDQALAPQLLTSRPMVLNQICDEASETIQHAINRLKISIERLKELN